MSDDADFVELVRDLERPIGEFLAQMTSDRSLAADLMQETSSWPGVSAHDYPRTPLDTARGCMGSREIGPCMHCVGSDAEWSRSIGS